MVEGTNSFAKQILHEFVLVTMRILNSYDIFTDDIGSECADLLNSYNSYKYKKHSLVCRERKGKNG